MKYDEGWMKNDEGWRLKDYDFKLLRGLADWQTDRQTDICDCRFAFATEKVRKVVMKVVAYVVMKVVVNVLVNVVVAEFKQAERKSKLY